MCTYADTHTHTNAHTHTNGIILSQDRETKPFAATQMDLEITILSKVIKRKTNTLHVESERQHKWKYLWNRNRLADIENNCPLTVAKAAEGGEGKDQAFGSSRHKLLYIGWINKVLLCSTGSYIHCPALNHNGKEYICTPCCTAEINPKL